MSTPTPDNPDALEQEHRGMIMEAVGRLSRDQGVSGFAGQLDVWFDNFHMLADKARLQTFITNSRRKDLVDARARKEAEISDIDEQLRGR